MSAAARVILDLLRRPPDERAWHRELDREAWRQLLAPLPDEDVLVVDGAPAALVFGTRSALAVSWLVNSRLPVRGLQG